jgi:hypothetical protein
MVDLRKGHVISERHIIKVEKIVTTQSCHTSKDAELKVDVKNINSS